jgi:TRAP-type C4-dicarboxylate transport system substrate-binding protein
MKRGLRILLIGVTIGLGLSFLSPLAALAAEDTIVWRLNSWCLPTREEGQAIQAFSDLVLKRSNGRLKIDVYPQFSLGIPWNQTLRAMKDDVAEMTMILSMYMGGEEPYLNVPEIPGIWKHKQQSIAAAAALQDFKKQVYKEDWGIVFIPWGHMVTYWDETLTRKGKPVRRLSDFKGMKIRVPNPRYQAIYKKLGASPQMIPPSEVYMAMQTGVVDGFASASCYAFDNKLFEVSRYDVPLSANLSGQQDILISDKAWNVLPPDLKKVVQDALAETGAMLNEKATATNVDIACRSKMKNEGVEYNYLPKEDILKYREIAMEAGKEWIDSQRGNVVKAWELIQPVLSKEYPDAMDQGGEQ